MIRILLIFYVFCLSGCTFYMLDSKYYAAKSSAKKYSGTYVINNNLYKEVIESTNKDEKLKFQRKLEYELKNNTNKEWLENKEKYILAAKNLSSYQNIKNAQKLFILEKINEKFPRILSNGKQYYTLDSINLPSKVQIPQDLESKIKNKIQDSKGNFKVRYIVYPQYFYFNDNNEVEFISFLVVYLYTNINKVYELKQDSNIEFASGEWKYLLYDNVFYDF